MEPHDAVRWSLTILLLGLPFVVVVYGAVRGASFAFFRTKYEHWRRVRRDLNKESRNGF